MWRLNPGRVLLPLRGVRAASGGGPAELATVSIGGIEAPLHSPSRSALVPVQHLDWVSGGGGGGGPGYLLPHLRWMLQKDTLGQDMFLIGAPGPTRRRLALAYCEMTNRDVEYLSLSRDTSEADLKQRREIRSGGTAFEDQCAVRAAVEGRVLLLEGIEKAERNVLPVLNNLLENREMQLEDGRFLMAPERYDMLRETHTQAEMDELRLVRVDERFRIIALGLPVPRFPGNPLDPPLRSRFQARDIRSLNHAQLVQLLDTSPSQLAQGGGGGGGGALTETVQAMVAAASTIKHLNATSDGPNSGISGHAPEMPPLGLARVAAMLAAAPGVPAADLLHLVYPHRVLTSGPTAELVQSTLDTFGLTRGGGGNSGSYTSMELAAAATPGGEGEVTLTHSDGHRASFAVPTGTLPPLAEPRRTLAGSQEALLSRLLVSHASADLCLLGGRGVGKTAVVEEFASRLGYDIQPVLVHKDMTARDLLQQRGTLPNGDTVWKTTPLVNAALQGSLAVLDGVHRADPSTIGVLQRLSQDREVTLHDGTVLLAASRYDAVQEMQGWSDAQMADAQLLRIHPSFRMVAMGEETVEGKKWFSEEIASMYDIHMVEPLSRAEEGGILRSVCPNIADDAVEKLLAVAAAVRSGGDSVLGSTILLSTRQLIRIAKRLERYPDESIANAIRRTSLSAFLPPMARASLDKLLETTGVESSPRGLFGGGGFDGDGDGASAGGGGSGGSSGHEIVVGDGPVAGEKELRIGDVTGRILPAAESNELLVPNVRFYDNPQHTAVMRDMLKDLELGEHLLLVGNQGVGKNKICDRLLYLLNRPREYIQLHRDTTIQTLTQQPSVEGGQIVYHPSPLVRAVENGTVLVIDEADKAPTHVTSVLKNLVESGDMMLADGRRIVPAGSTLAESGGGGILQCHPNFSMVVLANRPGFPFLGSDFFGSLGDVFGCHAVENPDMSAELDMLAKYGPSVDPEMLRKLAFSFGELRRLSNDGAIAYPYSMRELVHIVSHLEQYNDEGLSDVVRNVFDFDSYDPTVQETIVECFHKHGIPLGTSLSQITEAPLVQLPPPQLLQQWTQQSSEGVVCSTSVSALHAEQAHSVQTHTTDLDLVDARSRGFSEQETTAVLPFFPTQRLSDAAAAQDGTIYAITQNPIQLMTLPASQGSNSNNSNSGSMEAALPTLTATDLHDFFPRYHGDLRLKVASLEAAFPGCVAVVEPETGSILLVDAASSTVQMMSFDGGASSSSSSGGGGGSSNRSRGWGGLSRGTAADEETGYRICKELAAGGELVMYDDDDAKLLVVDMLANEVTTIALPTGGKIKNVMIPSRDSWVVSVESSPTSGGFLGGGSGGGEVTMYSLTKASGADLLPSVLTPIAVQGANPVMERILPSALSGIALKPATNGMHLISAPEGYAGSLGKLAPGGTVVPDGSYTVTGHLSGQGNRADGGATIGSAHCSAVGCIVTASTVDPDAYDNDGRNGNHGSSSDTDRDGKGSSSSSSRPKPPAATLEVIDTTTGTMRNIDVPSTFVQSSAGRKWDGSASYAPAEVKALFSLADGRLVTADAAGVVRTWEVSAPRLAVSLATWKKMIGEDSAGGGQYAIEYGNVQGRKEFERFSGLGNSDPKHGKEDPDNDPHVGGNTWAGGTGGRDTAGLGGKGGPYRLDKGHDVHQLSDQEKDDVPDHIKEAARKMGQEAFAKKLQEIEMSEYDHNLYSSFSSEVQQETRELKVILDGLEAKEDERVWLRHQTEGDLDDSKLIEGITGEHTIYKRRGAADHLPGGPQKNPKRITFVADVSGSMYRFNGHDQRLQRMLQTTCMIMEAFQDVPQDKVVYEIVGHSGESAKIPFVKEGSAPQNDNERLKVMREMHAHSQFCMSGDHTLEAAQLAIDEIAAREDADERYVVILSDANLDRYGIPPSDLGDILRSAPRAETKAFCIMVGSLGEQARRLQNGLPQGSSFVCMDTADLPKIMKQVFSAIVDP